jgi:hypothetical protein
LTSWQASAGGKDHDSQEQGNQDEDGDEGSLREDVEDGKDGDVCFVPSQHALYKLCTQHIDPYQCSVHLTSRYIFYVESIDRKSMQQSLMMFALPQKIFVVLILRSSPLFTV